MKKILLSLLLLGSVETSQSVRPSFSLKDSLPYVIAGGVGIAGAYYLYNYFTPITQAPVVPVPTDVQINDDDDATTDIMNLPDDETVWDEETQQDVEVRILKARLIEKRKKMKQDQENIARTTQIIKEKMPELQETIKKNYQLLNQALTIKKLLKPLYKDFIRYYKLRMYLIQILLLHNSILELYDTMEISKQLEYFNYDLTNYTFTPTEFFFITQSKTLKSAYNNHSAQEIIDNPDLLHSYKDYTFMYKIIIEQTESKKKKNLFRKLTCSVITSISKKIDGELERFSEVTKLHDLQMSLEENTALPKHCRALIQYINALSQITYNSTNFEGLEKHIDLYNKIYRSGSSLEDNLFKDSKDNDWILPEDITLPATPFIIPEATDFSEPVPERKRRKKKKKKITSAPASTPQKEAGPALEVSDEESFDVDIEPKTTAAAIQPVLDPARSGHIKLKARILDWFIKPERALLTQGYRRDTRNENEFKIRLLDTYGPEIIIQNHRFPRSLDTLVLFGKQHGEIEEHPGHSCYQLVFPGYIKQPGGAIQFGQYEYAFEKKESGTRVIFHRFFRPMTSEEIGNKFVKESGWHNPTSTTVPTFSEREKSEIQTNQEWRSTYEQEDWTIDEDSDPHYTVLRNPKSDIEYGIQKRTL